MEMLVGNLISVCMFGMVVAGLMKVFRIASDLHDIREILKDLQRENRLFSHTSGQSAGVGSEEQGRVSTLALMRAVNAEAREGSYEETPDSVRRP